jgi:serine O-acetyltransferase
MTVSPFDLLIIWLGPIGLLVALWLGSSLLVYVAVVSRRPSALQADLLRRYETKRALRSGSGLRRASFGWVARLLLADNCVQATVLYRLSRFLVRRRLRTLGEGTHSVSKFLTNLDISPHAEIGAGVYFYHGLGTVIGKGTTIGRGALICQQVTTGGGPTLGDDVRLWAGAKVIGRVAIGDRAEVGANGVVTSDVPADHIAIGVPATRMIPKSDARESDRQSSIESYNVS